MGGKMKYSLSNPRPIPIEKARDLFVYDPISGTLVFRVSRGGIRAGSLAGGINGGGYRQVKIDGVFYPAARIAYSMFYGVQPPAEIDHIDHDPLNNSIANLRPATRASNNSNASLRRDSSSGVKGVSWNKEFGKWRARVQALNRRILVGDFDSLEEAEKAIRSARSRLHGEFACYG